ncbi:ATP-binding cassette domain-containing protein [archaeon]|nr:MAG: ATP-binding cassette domain-containing protein [archaeon]
MNICLFYDLNLAYVFCRLSSLREENLVYTDNRVKLTNEVLQGIRAVKSYNWEGPFKERLQDIRKKEMQLLVAAGRARAVLVSALFAAPSFVAVFSLAVYTLKGNRLDPTKVFTSLALFNQLRFPLTFFPMLLNSLAEGKVSLDRLTKFFGAEEVAGYVETDYSEDDIKLAQTSQPLLLRNTVMIKNGTFSYSATQRTTANIAYTAADKVSDVQQQQQQQQRGMLSDINLSIKKGELIAVLGPTGSGKSTLLQALLGELHKVSGRVVIRGKVAYVPQASWIPNESLRNVVLFGKEMDHDKYSEALRVAGLTKDLELLDAGDLTEIGERGVNLSGGQKQRVSIARAVYEDADVVLLDDPLSALDSEVGARLFRDCIKGALRGKTRILVTHQLSVLSEVDRIVLMDVSEEDGTSRIVDQGSLRQLVARGYDLSKYISPTNNTEEEENKQEESPLASDESVMSNKPVIQPDASASPDATITLEQLEGSTGSALLLVGNMPPTGAMVDCTSSDCMAEEVVAAEVASISSAVSHDTYSKVPQPYDSVSKPGDGVLCNMQDGNQDVIAPSQRTKALMTKEERAEGAVSAKVYWNYLLEAKKPILFALMMLAFMLANASTILQQWVVAAWACDASYKLHTLPTYLTAVAGMASSVAGFTYLRTYLQCRLGAVASESLHNKMMKKVLNAPLNYFGK